MRIEGRLTRLEQGELQRLVSLYRRLGEGADDALMLARAWLKAEKEAPAVDCGDGMVDLEPTLRYMAVLVGLDPEEVIEEAKYILATKSI